MPEMLRYQARLGGSKRQVAYTSLSRNLFWIASFLHVLSPIWLLALGMLGQDKYSAVLGFVWLMSPILLIAALLLIYTRRLGRVGWFFVAWYAVASALLTCMLFWGLQRGMH
jgi:hypothetical protein